MTLAVGVSFDEARHEYWYKGQRLSGITGLITRKLGLKMPLEFVRERQEEGTHVHQAVQRWIAAGDPGSIHPGVTWLIACFMGQRDGLFSEVLVSDGKRYASMVDVVDDRGDGTLDIYDIKTGVFKREYCAWQMSVYQYLIEEYTEYRIRKLEVLAVRDKEVYPIFPKRKEAVEKLLYGGVT